LALCRSANWPDTLTDRRIPLKDDTAQPLFDVVVMANACIAARRARAGIYSDEHRLVHTGQRALRPDPKIRRCGVISKTITQTSKDAPGRRDCRQE
jgi:hypothetical protein